VERGLALVLPVALLSVLVAAAPSPEDARGALARAVALHQKGDLEGAVAAYRESLALAPSVEARSNLGAALAALGRYREAIEAYRGALAMAPGNGSIRYNLALAHYKSDDLSSAADELETLHAAQPGDLRATLLLADCRLRLAQFTRVEELLRPVVDADPDNRAALYALGMALLSDGRVEDGQPLVDRLLRGDDSAEAHYLLGWMAFSAGDAAKAVRELARALELNPTLPSLRSHYGRALLYTGDVDGAIAAFREALAESPNDYDANYHLAGILATRRKLAEARPHAERAVMLHPRSEAARSLLAGLDDPSRLPQPEDYSPLVGAKAPDVRLRLPGGGARRLSSLRGKPVLLAFGSLTCPQLRNGVPLLNELHERYGRSVTFLLVYIREAHAADGSSPLPLNERLGMSVAEARSLEERARSAALCRKRLSIPYEAVLDGMEGDVEKAFAAFPSRAYVIDREGVVTFSMGLDEQRLRPEALQAALEAVAR
jgi:tetratricopeptide (TPR) repeat protein